MLINREDLLEHIVDQKKKLDMLIWTLHNKKPAHIYDQINVVKSESAFDEINKLNRERDADVEIQKQHAYIKGISDGRKDYENELLDLMRNK